MSEIKYTNRLVGDFFRYLSWINNRFDINGSIPMYKNILIIIKMKL